MPGKNSSKNRRKTNRRSSPRRQQISPPKDKWSFWTPADDDLQDDDMVYEGGPMRLAPPTPKKDREPRPADETPNPAHSAGGEDPWRPHKPAHSAGVGVETAEARPTHSVGIEQAQETRSSQNPTETSHSASSPSETEPTTTSQKSATSPSSASDKEQASAPSTSKESLKRKLKKKPKAPAVLGRGSTPSVSPNYVRPYSIRHHADLEQQTTARTLRQLREETNERYKKSFDAWDRKKGMPPQAFTEGWYDEQFCLPFINWYKELEPIVAERQAEDLRLQAALEAEAAELRQATEAQATAQAEENQMEADPSASTEDNTIPAAQVELDDGELDLAEPGESTDHVPVTAEEAAMLLDEFQFGSATQPAPNTVPSPKPAKTPSPAARPLHSSGMPVPAQVETTHSVVPTQAPTAKEKPTRKTVAAVKRHGKETTTSSSRTSSTGSKRSREPTGKSRSPPSKDARRDKRRQSRSLSPSLKRHKDRLANTNHRSLVPVIDGFVSKDWAVRVALAGHQQQEWVQQYLDPEKKYELLGLINRLGVPASYLRVDYCNRPNAAGDQAPLANITYDQLLTENNIIPWKFILFSTIGALPAYYRQCNQKTWPHLSKYLDDSDKYRDLDIGGIGPVGFDLSGLPPNNVAEFEEQRKTLTRFARIAHRTGFSLTIVVHYDQEQEYTSSLHADAIRALREEGLSSRQKIHLIVSRANAFELVMWLEAFPRTLLSFDFYFLSAIRQTVNKPPYDPQAHENFRQAQAIQDFLQYVPLENISLHSASPAPTGPIEQGHHRTPLDLLAAAAEFQTITETKPDVVLTNSARNLVHFYHLDERLLDHAVSHHEHSRKNVGPRKTLEEFSAHIRSLFGVAPRAAREQERLPSRSEPRSRSAAIRSMRQRRSSSSDAHRRRRSPVKRPSPTKPRANREPSPQRDSRSKPPHSGERDPRSRPPHSGRRDHHQTKDTHRSLSRNRSPRKQPTHFMVNIDQNPQQTVRYVPPLYVLPNTDATREKKPIRLCDLKLPPPNQLSFSSRLEGRVARGGQALQDLPEPWQLYSGSRLEGRIAERGHPLPVPSVRQKIQALKSLQQSMPQPSVLQQLQDLRQQSPQRPTHSVGNVPPMQQPAHSAESEPPASQSEVTTRAHAPDPRLYKKEPVFTMEMFPQDLSSDEVYHEVNQLLEREEEDEGMRPLLSENLASVTLVPAQPEVFQVPRQPGPEPNPFDPFHECDGDGEDRTVFHLSLKIVEYVSNRHWKNQRGIRGSSEYQELLKKVRRLKVRSLAQMTLLKYISRLRGNDEVRTPLALKLLHQVLTAQDLSHSLPRILLECHANLTDDDTNDPWPTCKDFRHAVEHWSCYCSHAAVYIFEHLSGPIHFDPNWFRDAATPDAVRDALVLPNVHDRGDAINDVRHQVYVQYGYDHIMAVLRGVPDIDWLRFDASRKTKFPLGLPLMAPTIVFVDRYIWDTFGKDLRTDVEMILIQNSTRDEIIGELRKYFPHSSTTRVILWMGPDYFTEGNMGYMFIVASFCHHYSTYFGHVEQYVVLPTYIRSKRMRWGYSVLSSYIQRRQLLPYARVAIDPLAVRLWERDERLSSVQGRLPKWFDCGLDENGHYTSDGLIYATRGYLTLYHDLDLWKDMDKPSNDDDDALSIATVEAMQTTEPSTSDTCHTSSASGDRPTATPLDFQLPSTSSGTHSVPGVDVEAIAASIAQKLFREGASASSAEELSKCALKIAMDLAMQEHAPRLQNIAQKLDKTQRPSKTSDSQKDSDHDPRKDQDREPRK